ncbi:MAG: hypothetical protein ACFCGT_28400 [Sandaracinaceae bacterium]
MDLLARLALGGAPRIEEALGRRAALRAFLALLEREPEGETRRGLVERALRLAVDLDERDALEALLARYRADPDAGELTVAVRLCREWLADGRVAPAVALAAAEATRATGSRTSGRSAYLEGRLRERAGEDPQAVAAYERAIASGPDDVVRAAEVRRVRVLRRMDPRQGALAASDLLPADGLPPSERLAIAEAALLHPGRYRRAAALDVLEALAGSGEPGAVLQAAAHVDAIGRALTATDADRATAVLAHHADPVARRLAEARVRAVLDGPARPDADAEAAAVGVTHADPAAEALLPAAQRVAEGRDPGPRPDAPYAAYGWLGLRALFLLDRGERGATAAALREAAPLADVHGPAAPLWTAALEALGPDDDAAAAGLELLDRFLDAAGPPPPDGYLAAAGRLEELGETGRCRRALTMAHARREPNARALLGTRLREDGFRAAERGEQRASIALLRAAKALLGGAGGA